MYSAYINIFNQPEAGTQIRGVTMLNDVNILPDMDRRLSHGIDRYRRISIAIAEYH